MKRLAIVALAGMLAVNGGATPAFAKKGDEPVKAKALKLSDAFRTAATPVDAAIKANNLAAVPAMLPALDAAATTPDEKFVANQFRYQYAVKANDVAMQKVAIGAMIDSGAAPADVMPQLLTGAAQTAYASGDYAMALQRLNQLSQAGKADANAYLMLAEIQFKQKQFQAGSQSLSSAVKMQQASGQPVPEAWLKRGFAAAYTGKLADTDSWADQLLSAYPSPENWRLVMEVMLSRYPQRSMLLDSYRLMSATNSLGGESGYRGWAETAWQAGLPGETKIAIDQAYTKGGVAPGSSLQLKELGAMASGRIAADKASLNTGKARAQSAPDGKVALGAAEGFSSYGDYASAVPLYRLALSKGGIDADAANTHLGIALFRTGDKAGAISAFQAVKGDRAAIARLWIAHLNRA